MNSAEMCYQIEGSVEPVGVKVKRAVAKEPEDIPAKAMFF
jgi:hypothetical protein